MGDADEFAQHFHKESMMAIDKSILDSANGFFASLVDAGVPRGDVEDGVRLFQMMINEINSLRSDMNNLMVPFLRDKVNALQDKHSDLRGRVEKLEAPGDHGGGRRHGRLPI